MTVMSRVKDVTTIWDLTPVSGTSLAGPVTPSIPELADVRTMMNVLLASIIAKLSVPLMIAEILKDPLDATEENATSVKS